MLIKEEALWAGFVMVAAAPPAVAVIPFTVLLKGDGPFSLIATVGTYLAALILMPLITFGMLGAGYADHGKLVWIMVELILAPLAVSRLLRRTTLAEKLEPYKGAVTNWGFFLVSYTIVGLNRSVFLTQPFSILPVFLVALAAIFLLGWTIERTGRLFKIDPSKAAKPGPARHPEKYRLGRRSGPDPARGADGPAGNRFHGLYDRVCHLAES